MKKLLTILLTLNLVVATAQEKNTASVGDVFVTASKSSEDFESFDLPRKNIILKRGGILSSNTIENTKIQIVSIEEKKNSNTQWVVKRTDGRKFFNAYPTLKVAAEVAINKEELKPLQDNNNPPDTKNKVDTLPKK